MSEQSVMNRDALSLRLFKGGSLQTDAFTALGWTALLAVVFVFRGSLSFQATLVVTGLMSAWWLGSGLLKLRDAGRSMSLPPASAVIGLTLLVGVIPQALAVSRGEIEPLLTRLGLILPDYVRSARDGLLMLLMSGIAVRIGEILATRAAHKRGERAALRRSSAFNPLLFGLLFGIGLASDLYQVRNGLGALLGQRGTSTQSGIVAVAAQGIPLALAYAVSTSGKRSVFVRILCLGGLAGLLLLGVRSPLILVAMAAAYLAAERMREAPRLALRYGLIGGLAGYLVLAMLAALPQYRSDVVQTREANPLVAIGQGLIDPVSQLPQAGFDTLEGARFALYLQHAGFQGDVTDLTKVVTQFLPRSLWPEKPPWLSSKLSGQYLGYGGSGMFLSGVGYLSLITGHLRWALLGFALIGFATATMARTLRDPMYAEILPLYFSLRFFSGGDAFDLFYVVGLGLLYGLARAISGLLNLEHG